MNRFLHGLLYVALMAVSLISIKSMHGVVEVPRFLSSFKSKIARHRLAIVHFVNYDALLEEEKVATAQKTTQQSSQRMTAKERMKIMDDLDMADMKMSRQSKEMLDSLDQMKEAFKDAAESTRYERAGVGFIGVDVTQLPELIKEYDLHQLSTVMIFKDGVPFKDQGEIIKNHELLTTRAKIKNFIDTYCEKLIEDILEQVDMQERERPRTRVTRVYTYPRYSTYYAPGYYGYGYPSWGYGWRYPYWRRYGYWGPAWGGFDYGGYGYRWGARRAGLGIGFGW